eukprot:s4151_g2.t1
MHRRVAAVLRRPAWRTFASAETLAKATALAKGSRFGDAELGALAEDCSTLEPLQLRELLNSFAQASTHVPETLWTGLAASVPRAVEELNAMQVVTGLTDLGWCGKDDSTDSADSADLKILG